MENDSLTRDHVAALYRRGLLDLVYEAAGVHRRHHDPAAVQCASLLSVKTGGCPEDCAYCPQSARYDTGVESTGLMSVSAVATAAARARAGGADRFCIGAAWRQATDGPAFDRVLEMIGEIKALGLESCATLGMLDRAQAGRLRAAGLDYYNHNLDTSPDYYGEVITTRTYQDRLDTLAHVRNAGMKVCCGGIVGMGETREDRAGLLVQLANLPEHPESVPINNLVQAQGTPMHGSETISPLETVRCIALARILMPRSVIRLSAGRTDLSEETQALCFLAGAGSIFCGDRLLTTPNPSFDSDMAMFDGLGLAPQAL
jgi:biotin synthase